MVRMRVRIYDRVVVASRCDQRHGLCLGLPRAVAMDAHGPHPLDFIQNPSYGLAMLSSDQPRLGWATSPNGQGALSQLFISAVDGSQLTTPLTDTATITAPHPWVAQRWSQDGPCLYFSTEPYGIGGFTPWRNGLNSWKLNIKTADGQPVDNAAPAPIIDQIWCASLTKPRPRLTVFCKGMQRKGYGICQWQSAPG
jgi:hypothetical protein